MRQSRPDLVDGKLPSAIQRRTVLDVTRSRTQTSATFRKVASAGKGRLVISLLPHDWCATRCKVGTCSFTRQKADEVSKNEVGGGVCRVCGSDRLVQHQLSSIKMGRSKQ